MSTYRTSYKVVLKDKTEFTVNADDVNMNYWESGDEDEVANCYFDFTIGEDNDEKTVAAVPYNQVAYITSLKVE